MLKIKRLGIKLVTAAVLRNAALKKENFQLRQEIIKLKAINDTLKRKLFNREVIRDEHR